MPLIRGMMREFFQEFPGFVFVIHGFPFVGGVNSLYVAENGIYARPNRPQATPTPPWVRSPPPLLGAPLVTVGKEVQGLELGLPGR